MMSSIKALAILFLSSLALLQTSAFLTTNHHSTRKVSFLVLHERAEIRNEANYDIMAGVADSTKQAFQGKSILLTGASGGLGKEIALQLAHCNVLQIVLSGRNQEALELVATECKEICPTIRTHVLTCDLSDKASVQQLGEQALKVCDNRIDVLINNGGVSSRGNFVDTTIDVDEKVMQINFLSGAALAKAVVPTMINNQSGKIIWISSIQGLIGIPSRTSYGASKFAVEGYCQSLRAELASSGVTVHVISPGYIRTNLSRSALKGDGSAHGKLDETTAKGRPPQEVAIALLDAVGNGKSELVVAATFTAWIALWLRFLAPTQLQKLLVKQFEKSKTKVD
jgi:dehydrogenase/reductase SDR family protein 7B